MSRDGLAKRRWIATAALSATLAATAALVASSDDEASAATGTLKFREVTQGSRGFEVRGESAAASGRVARSASQAATVLRGWGVDSAATRSVDFARDSAILVMATYQQSGGYRARVSRVRMQGRQVMLTGSVRHEGGELATQSIERPWVLITVKRASLARASRNVRVQLR